MVVKLHVTPEQEVLFKKNYCCTRKTYNEILNKYKSEYGDSNKIPTKNELNQFLKDSRKRIALFDGNSVNQSSTGADDLHKAFKNSAKSKRHNPPKFHSKKNIT